MWWRIIDFMDRVAVGVDWTVFFACLTEGADIERSLYGDLTKGEQKELLDIMEMIALRWESDEISEGERRAIMRKHNPAIVPRNWMLFEAYQAASDEGGRDYEPTRELLQILKNPYVYGDDEVAGIDKRFFGVTPLEYRNVAGLAFLS